MDLNKTCSVRLISKTEGAKGTEYEGKSTDEIVVGVARVSTSRDINDLFESPEKLLRYCIRNQHWSVLESVNMTFEIITSRAISHEIVRHRSMNFQEFCMDGNSKVLLESGKTKMLVDLYRENAVGESVVVYSQTENKFKTAQIKEVFNTGKKQVYEFILSQGKSIKCTEDHKVLSYDRGVFLPIKEIVVEVQNSPVTGKRYFVRTPKKIGVYDDATKNIYWDYIVEFENCGIRQTFDLEINHITNHNYVADGVVVHNSLRYSDALSIQEVELRKAGTTNRQSSSLPIDKDTDAREILKNESIKNSVETYVKLFSTDIAKETARFVLPLSTTTKLNMTGNIRSIVTFLNARLHNTAQKEIREVAEMIRDILISECPIISKCFFNFDGAYDMHILEKLVLDRHKLTTVPNA